MPNARRTATLSLLALLPQPLLAQDAVVLLDTVTLTTSDETSASTTTRSTAEQPLPLSLDTLFRSMAGVTTQGGSLAEAETAINIRGLQDHGRVAVSIDGARQNFARAGHGANGTFTLDPEMLRSVSVTRGPGAAAGAIGGAVEMTTIRAENLIAEGETAGGEARLRYGSAFEAPTLHAAWATRTSATTDLTFAATRAETAAYRAGNGTEVPAGQFNRSALLKFGWQPSDANALTLSAQTIARSYITGVDTSTPRDTDLRQQTFTLDHRFTPDNPLIDLHSILYHTGTEVAQDALTPDLTPTGAHRRYDTATTGLRLTNIARFDTGPIAHELTLTLEAFEDRVTTDDPGNDSLTPSGTRSVWSLNAADRLLIGETAVTLGLSGDGYRLSSADGGSSGTALSPRLAVEQPLSDRFTLHGALSLGYRPPALSEALVDGAHPEPADFAVRPNPNLKAERAFTSEIGLSHDGTLFSADDTLSARATVFRNIVSDYIGMEWVGGVFNGYYQYQNTARVRIEGVELEAAYENGAFFADLTAQHLRGIDRDTGAELSRVAPDRAVLSAGLRTAPGHETGARLTSVAAKSGDLPSASWTTLDLFLTRPVGAQGSFGLALNNILDETYTPHLETQPAPGINVQASLTYRF